MFLSLMYLLFSTRLNKSHVLLDLYSFPTRRSSDLINVLLRYNVFNAKTYLGGLHMTQVHFTLNNEEVQSIIEHSVKDDVSKNILTTIFNQLMEEQRTEYIDRKSTRQNSSHVAISYDV